MVAGEPMAAALPLARPYQTDRSTDTFAVKWRSVVASGLSGQCLVQLSYTINVARPQSLFMGTYGREKGELSVDDVTNIVKMDLDYRPSAIAQPLALQEPKYQKTASKGFAEPWHRSASTAS